MNIRNGVQVCLDSFSLGSSLLPISRAALGAISFLDILFQHFPLYNITPGTVTSAVFWTSCLLILQDGHTVVLQKH